MPPRLLSLLVLYLLLSGWAAGDRGVLAAGPAAEEKLRDYQGKGEIVAVLDADDRTSPQSQGQLRIQSPS